MQSILQGYRRATHGSDHGIHPLFVMMISVVLPNTALRSFLPLCPPLYDPMPTSFGAT